MRADGPILQEDAGRREQLAGQLGVCGRPVAAVPPPEAAEAEAEAFRAFPPGQAGERSRREEGEGRRGAVAKIAIPRRSGGPSPRARA